MKPVIHAIALACALAAGYGFAQSGAELAKAKGCLTCHDISTKKVGPSFKDLAAKYKDDKAAEANLVQKLKDGKGHMKASATDAELKSVVQYTLSVK
jgi:cytochrome c